MPATMACKHCGTGLDASFMNPGDDVLCVKCGKRTPVPDAALRQVSEDSTESEPTVEAAHEVRHEVDEAGLRMYIEGLKREQSLGMGIVGGAAGAAIGAVVWATIVAVTHYQIGLVAIAIGFFAGYGVRTLGKGLEKSFGVLGAVLALLGVACGNLLSVLVLIAKHESMSFFSLLGMLDVVTVANIMKASFGAMDLLFYVIAIYEGYRFSFRRLTQEEIGRFVRPAA